MHKCTTLTENLKDSDPFYVWVRITQWWVLPSPCLLSLLQALDPHLFHELPVIYATLSLCFSIYLQRGRRQQFALTAAPFLTTLTIVYYSKTCFVSKQKFSKRIPKILLFQNKLWMFDLIYITGRYPAVANLEISLVKPGKTRDWKVERKSIRILWNAFYLSN